MSVKDKQNSLSSAIKKNKKNKNKNKKVQTL